MAFYISSFSDEQEVQNEYLKLPLKLIGDARKNYICIDNTYYKNLHFDFYGRKIHFHNVGGGFQKSIVFTEDRIKEYEEGKISFTNEIPQTYVYSKITIEGWENKFVYGYHNPLIKWNGWTIPYFTFEALKEINNLCDEDNLLFRLYDEESGKTVEYMNKYDEEAPYIIIPTIINGITLYECGLGFTWSIMD